jgi:DNA-binding transcriptional regulator YdaS (Cro superfamily)
MTGKGRNLLSIGLAMVFVAGAALACGPAAKIPVTVVIESPGSGSPVSMGQQVVIDSTVAAEAGVERVELAVDGQVVRRDVPPSGNPTEFRVSQLWTPTAPGQAMVSVVAYDVNGASSEAATIMLHVATSGEVVPPETPATTGGDCALDSQFVADVTIPDGTAVSPGQAFVKTWRVRNSGTCDWGAGFELACVSGAQMGGPASVPLPAIPAGGEAEVSVNLTTPSTYGTHKGTWRIASGDGTLFGTNLAVTIVVPAPATDAPQPPPPPD